MPTYKIIQYVSGQGQNVYQDWLYGLRDGTARIAIDRRIARLEQGNFGDHKPCADGVWELRIDVGPGYRIYYAVDGAAVVLLLVGGDKRTQSRDIKRAVQLWNDWKGRTHDRRG